MTRTARWLATAAATVVGLGWAVAPAAAFDLSGTWTGKISCKGSFNGASLSEDFSPTMLIEDDGTTLAVAVDGVHFSAASFPTAGHPEKGDIALIRCDTSSTRSGGDFGGEVARLKVTTKTGGGGGSLGGSSVRASLLIARTVETCKWTFKRVSTAPVSLDACVAPPA